LGFGFFYILVVLSLSELYYQTGSFAVLPFCTMGNHGKLLTKCFFFFFSQETCGACNAIIFLVSVVVIVLLPKGPWPMNAYSTRKSFHTIFYTCRT
jgi:hypothetical protein